MLSTNFQDSIALDEDLLAYSARSIETLVSVGMQLGVSVKKRTQLPLSTSNASFYVETA